MKPIDFYSKLAEIESSGELTLSPGPFVIRVGQSDKDAGNILRELVERYDEEATILDLESDLLYNVLIRLRNGLRENGNDFKKAICGRETQAFLDALWWLRFFSAQSIENHQDCNCVDIDIPGQNNSCPICEKTAREAYNDEIPF